MRKFFSVIFFLTALLISSCSYEAIEPEKPEVTDSMVSYSKTIFPLVTTQCNSIGGCHESGSQDGDFTTYEGLKKTAANGTLLNRVVTVQDMPKISSGLTLTNEERSYFSTWIKQGFPNN